MTISKNSFKTIAIKAARAGDSKKASPVRVYDLAGRSSLADFAVLMAVESAPQLEAVEEEVLLQLKHEGVYCLHKDGMQSKNWKVLDYGGVLVHVYDVKAEEFYSIGRVYESYKPVAWEETPAAAPAPAAKKEEAPAKAAPAKPAAKKTKPVKKAAVKKAKPAAKKAKPAAKKAKPVAKKAKPVAKKAKPAAKKAAAKKAKPVKKAAAKKAKPAKKAAKKISKKKK